MQPTYRTHFQYVSHNKQLLRYVAERQQHGNGSAVHYRADSHAADSTASPYHNLRKTENSVNYDEYLSCNSLNLVKIHVELLDQVEEMLHFFTHELPNNYGQQLLMAAKCDKELFAEYKKEPSSHLQRRQSKSPFVSDFDYFLHMASLTAKDFIALIIRSNVSLDMMFCTWNALKQQHILLGIENILNEYFYQHASACPSNLHYKLKLAEEFYYNENCTLSFIAKILNYRSSRLIEESKNQEKNPQKQVRYSSVLRAINHSNANLIVCLMVMFYIMGCRTICGLSPYAEPFSTRGLPKKISTYVAYGAYKAVKQLFALTQQEKQLAKSQFVIPSFTTYYYVLKGYFEHKLDLFYCAKCGVLQFYHVDDSTNFPIKFDCILCGGELLSCEKQLDRSICQDQVNLQ